MTTLSRLLALAALTTAVPAAVGQVTFTVTATPNADAYGYLSTNQYVFVFTSTGISAPNGADLYNSSGAFWYEIYTTDSPLWSTISGGGMQGTYVHPPIPPSNDTNGYKVGEITASNYIDVGIPHYSLSVSAQTVFDTNANMGLKTPDGSRFIGGITVRVTSNDGNLPAFAGPSEYQSPTSYFAPYVGVYTPTFETTLYLQDAVAFQHSPLIFFTVNSVQIGAVPEPATYLLIGMGILGVALHRWRRTAG